MTGGTVATTRESHKYKTLVTYTGQAKIAAAALNGTKVNITTAVVGDGGGTYYAPTADMTELKNEVWRGEIANKKINSASANMIDVKVVLDGTVGGWTIREAGLIDEDGDLIAICNLPDTEKAVILDGVASALTILLHVVFTNVDVVTFAVDPSVDHVTAHELDSVIQSHNDDQNAHADLLPSTELITLDHGLGAWPQVMITAYRYGAGMGGAGEGPAGGSDAVQAPVRAVFHGSGSLTVYTTEAIARPGTAKDVRKISDTEYIVTYDGDDTSAVYIQLLCAPKLRIEDFLSYKFITLHHGLGTYPQVIAGALRYGAGMGAIGEGPAGGTDLKQVFVRVEYQDRDTLTIYTTEDVARPNVQKEIYKAGDCDYAVAYKENGVDSVHIQLIASKEKMVLPEKVVVSPNLGLKILEE